ncbi:MAG TPA: type II toxin-antitoxin system prevent-host-death family antitoxin [Vicinamibacterales bacterium]|nr:type II toxin-antitoxin system prevent-host-death family antitoxin [Vicinamibacterales bacterium]
MSTTETVGVRELRQNASVYLRRVQAGETIEITDRGVPVAILAPVPRPMTKLDQLIAEGKATPAKGDLLDLKGPRKKMPRGWVDRELRRQRADRKL